MISAIILAAGNGTRANLSENKMLHDYNGIPLLLHSLSVFSAVADEIVVTCRPQDEARIKKLISPYHARTCHGGNSRTESVFNALETVLGDIVLIHDGARPHVTEKLVRDCIRCTEQYKSAIPGVPTVDTAAIAVDGEIISYPVRSELYLLQTPQGYFTRDLRAAYELAFAEGNAEKFTDEGSICLKYLGLRPHIFPGDRANVKITYPEDFNVATRVGFGVDTHAFYGENEGMPLANFIKLGGVNIPSSKILKAHSDGDVLVHALMDALLTAAGLRDIGYYFPDTDERYRGADSMELLSKVLRLVEEKHLQPQNVSISVLAETPHLSPYIEAIAQSLSEALGLPRSAVGVAAGTNEKLGYVGEGKGITVYATVLLK